MPVELVRLQNMTTLNTGDPLAPLQRKESNISFPEANVQTLGLGFSGSPLLLDADIQLGIASLYS